MLERRLGLPLLCLADLPACAETADPLGDTLLTEGTNKSTRHHLLVGALCRATQAVRGATHTFETKVAPTYSHPSCPDFVTEFGGSDGAHALYEVKLYNTIVTDQTRLRRGASYSFGATEAYLREEILGEHAGTEKAPLAPRSDGKQREAKY